MKKIIKNTIAILILLVMMSLQVSYAVSNVNVNTFLSANKEEIKDGENLEITVDLSKIDSDKFTLNLTSNVDIKDIIVKENIETTLNATTNSMSIEIDKSEITISKITLTYILSENENIGEKIQFIAQVLVTDVNTNIESISKEEKLEISISSDDENKNETRNDSSETKTDKDNKDNKDNKENVDDKTDANSKTENKEMPSGKSGDNLEYSKEQISNNSEKKSIAGALKSQSSSISNSVKSMASSAATQASSVETAVYNGSSNNYLSSLEIEGVTLKTTFNKEKETYFAEAEGLTSANIITTKENENAKVYITGASSLKTGTNKILVSVTAENGNVRYYRIFLENK